jgi:RNA polymerase sigma factor (sigma-70 family)
MSLALSVTPPAPACSEHDLVAAVRQGDDRAFEELYSRYRRRITSYVLGMVGDHGRAEDITQEVFMSALRRIRASERPIAFKAWVYEIAKNACIDEFRRTRRAQEVPLETDDESGRGDRGLLSSAPTPDAAAESRQQLTDLRGAFRGLSESHHKILVLRELEGLSYTQIGERMGMSKPVVESTLFRARRRLSEEYEELISGRRCEHVQTVIAGPSARRPGSIGVREQRLLARHLAHCQPCRRHAHLAGFDDSALKTGTGWVGKVAALLPFPILRWRRGGAAQDAVSATRTHQIGAVQSMQTITNYVASPASPFAGMGRAAAAAATLVIAGAGGGIVTAVSSQSSPSHNSSRASSAAGGSALPAASRASGGASGVSGSNAAAAAAKRAGGTGSGSGSVPGINSTSATGRQTAGGTTAGGSTTGSGTHGTSGGGAGGDKATPAANAGGAAGDSVSPSMSATPTGSTSGSSGTTIAVPNVPIPAPRGLPALPGPGALPTVALPQIGSLGLPKTGTLLGQILGLTSSSTSSTSSSSSTDTSTTSSNTTSGTGGLLGPVVGTLSGK